MDDPTDVSSQDGSGRHTLDEGSSTRNRKVEGSNPSSGSKPAGQRVFLALLTAKRQLSVIPLGWISAAGAPSQRFLSTTLPQVSRAWVEPVRSLLEAPSPAVLTTYRKDGSAHTVPVWFRWVDDAFEVVIVKGDVKLRHLARDPRCVLVVFEAVRPFRGLEVRGVAELVEGDVTSARAAIAECYLGVGDGEHLPPNGDPRQGY
jgi:PPOX class probable F420-dependent enzyme